jgi:NADPH:quinone reductase
MRHVRVVVVRYGGPDELQVVEEERPAPKRGEVLVRVLAAGVALPDVMMREGIHPETPRLPFTPGWDLVGVVDRLGEDVSGLDLGQRVAALPITGAYAEFVCLPQSELVPVPPELDPAEVVSLVLNYVTAYQMLHRSARAGPGLSALVHGAAGGVGSALVQLGRAAGLAEVYGTCSAQSASIVSGLGAIPIDYRQIDFVDEVRRRTRDGVDMVFDGIGGSHVWRSRSALRRGGRVVVYGITSSLRGGRSTSARPGRRRRYRAIAVFGLHILGGWVLPGRRRVVPYSIQWLKRLRPAWFRADLAALLDLLQRRQIRPLIARRLPISQARRAHELLGEGGVTGKIVLVADGSATGSAV